MSSETRWSPRDVLSLLGDAVFSVLVGGAVGVVAALAWAVAQ